MWSFRGRGSRRKARASRDLSRIFTDVGVDVQYILIKVDPKHPGEEKKVVIIQSQKGRKVKTMS